MRWLYGGAGQLDARLGRSAAFPLESTLGVETRNDYDRRGRLPPARSATASSRVSRPQSRSARSAVFWRQRSSSRTGCASRAGSAATVFIFDVHDRLPRPALADPTLRGGPSDQRPRDRRHRLAEGQLIFTPRPDHRALPELRQRLSLERRARRRPGRAGARPRTRRRSCRRSATSSARARGSSTTGSISRPRSGSSTSTARSSSAATAARSRGRGTGSFDTAGPTAALGHRLRGALPAHALALRRLRPLAGPTRASRTATRSRSRRRCS